MRNEHLVALVARLQIVDAGIAHTHHKIALERCAYVETVATVPNIEHDILHNALGLEVVVYISVGSMAHHSIIPRIQITVCAAVAVPMEINKFNFRVIHTS